METQGKIVQGIVPDHHLILEEFFGNARERLSELVTSDSDLMAAAAVDGGLSSLADCRAILLKLQQEELQSCVDRFRSTQCSGAAIVTVEQVQDRLAHLNDEEDGIPQALRQQSASLDKVARQAFCRLVLYMESHSKIPTEDRDLQTEGSIDSKTLLEFAALCRTSVQLDCVQRHLEDPCSQALFQDLYPLSVSTATVDKLPQKRLEYVQRLCAQAVGVHPSLITKEFQRVFASPPPSPSSTPRPTTVDPHVKSTLESLVDTMNDAVMNANLRRISQQPLSDVSEGGVTRVISVQHTTTRQEGSDNHSSSAFTLAATGELGAPQAQRMQHQSSVHTEAITKEQLRLASQAQNLQHQLLQEMRDMTPRERQDVLQKARQAQQEFLQQVAKLSPGPERIHFLQSMDPDTSRLLAMSKAWTAELEAQSS